MNSVVCSLPMAALGLFAQAVPWIMVAVVTLGLLILMRWRWQQTSILTRCVVLSLYAHFIFGTLILSGPWFSRPLKAWGNPARFGSEVRVRFTSETATDLQEEHVSAPELLPPEPGDIVPENQQAESGQDTSALLEKLASSEATSPLLTELPRMEVKVAANSTNEPPSSLAEVLAEVAPRYADAISAPAVEQITSSPPTTTSVATPPAAEMKTIPRKEPVAVPGHRTPELYRLRFDRSAAELSAQGGTPDSEAAVQAALVWLAAKQEADGRWSAAKHEAGRGTHQAEQARGDTGADADTGITALAILAFLGAGHTHLAGEYRESVQHGLEFLLASQKQNGSLAGGAKLYASMYCHGMATFAVAEALAITGDERLQPYLERAVLYSVQSQHVRGGWRYQPGDVGDMSQFGWQIMALKSAELAGVSVPKITLERATLFLHSVSSGEHQALASYRAGERATPTMTAEAWVCRHLLQSPITAEQSAHAAEFLLRESPSARKTNIYYWYYGTLATRQIGGNAWQEWNTAMRSALLETQRGSGNYAGSWDPDPLWGGYGGRVFQTALSALCLEAYYRYDLDSEK